MFVAVSLLLATVCLLPAAGKLLGHPKMRQSAAHFAIPWSTYQLIGAAELAAAAGVLIGLRWLRLRHPRRHARADQPGRRGPALLLRQAQGRRKRPTAPTRSSAHPAKGQTRSSRPGTSSTSSAAAPGKPANSLRQSTYCSSARHKVMASPGGDLLWVSGALPGSVHDKKAEWVWGVLDELENAGLAALADKGYQGSTWAKVPYRGKNSRGRAGPRPAAACSTCPPPGSARRPSAQPPAPRQSLCRRPPARRRRHHRDRHGRRLAPRARPYIGAWYDALHRTGDIGDERNRKLRYAAPTSDDPGRACALRDHASPAAATLPISSLPTAPIGLSW